MDNICHKNRMNTRVITLWRIDVTSLTTSESTMHFLAEKTVNFAGNQITFINGHMINRILHLWLLHMKFMKLT